MNRLNDLKAIISDLMIKDKLEFNTALSDIQQLILDDYKLEYSQDEIETCLLELWYQDEIEEYEESEYYEMPRFLI